MFIKKAGIRPEGIKKIAFRHFSHEHELILGDSSLLNTGLLNTGRMSRHHMVRTSGDSSTYDTERKCHLCGEVMYAGQKNSTAMCYVCTLFWHKSCLDLPQHITHPFHPHHTLTQSEAGSDSGQIRCNACNRPCDRFGLYKCSDESCGYCLDLGCVVLAPSKTTPSISISTDHKLVCPLSDSDSSHHLILCDTTCDTVIVFACSVCRRPFPGHVREAAFYVCLKCRIGLHGSCADHLLPRHIKNHPIHPEHPLDLCRGRYELELYPCDGHFEQLYYNCSQCSGFRLPTTLPTTAAASHDHNNNSSQSQSQIIGHIHPVTYLDFQPNKYRLQCFACKDAVKVDPVFCFCRECRVVLHKSCATLPRQIQHPCHPQHTLTIFDSLITDTVKRPLTACVACRNRIDGYSYRCDPCGFILHSKCAMGSILYPAIKSECHPHPLVYFKSGLEHNGYPKNYCQACKPNDREPNDPMFSCWKQSCNFYVHAHCLPKSELPPSVKNIHHLHALNLTYSRIRDPLDDYSSCEYYCDSCEEKRKLSLPTYYCAGCHFVAHVDCNIAEIINHFKTLGLAKDACQIMEGDDDVKSLFDNVDEEIATESATLARLKAKTDAHNEKLDRLKEEMNLLAKELNQLKEETVEQSEKLDQLKQRRAQLDTSK